MSEKSNLTSSSYVPSLDGLRGLSIITVLIAHMGYERLVPGGLGVTIFFFISGYLITNLMIDEYVKTGKVHLKLFYFRRLLRLYPPLLLMVAFVTVYAFFFLKPVLLKEIFAAVFYYENYLSFYSSGARYFGTLWSLAVEEHFYLAFPILFIVLFKTPKKFLIVLTFLIFTALIIRYLGTIQYSKEDAQWYCYQLTHTRFDSILYGCLASVLLYVDVKGKFFTFISNKLTFIAALLIMAFCLVFRNDLFRNTLRYTLQGLALMVLIPALVNASAYKKINLFFSNGVIVYIGKLSYSIYLFHMIAITICTPIKQGHHQVLFLIAATALTVLFSQFSFYLVEKPLGKLRKRLRPVSHVKKPIAETVLTQQ